MKKLFVMILLNLVLFSVACSASPKQLIPIEDKAYQTVWPNVEADTVATMWTTQDFLNNKNPKLKEIEIDFLTGKMCSSIEWFLTTDYNQYFVKLDDNIFLLLNKDKNGKLYNGRVFQVTE